MYAVVVIQISPRSHTMGVENLWTSKKQIIPCASLSLCRKRKYLNAQETHHGILIS